MIHFASDLLQKHFTIKVDFYNLFLGEVYDSEFLYNI